MAEHIFLLQTGCFSSTEVQEHFINPCCFGEDFAAWLMPKPQALLEQAADKLWSILQANPDFQRLRRAGQTYAEPD